MSVKKLTTHPPEFPNILQPCRASVPSPRNDSGRLLYRTGRKTDNQEPSEVTFRVELLSWEEARTAAAPVRYAVFLEEKDAPPGVELDDIDPQCIHALALDESGKAVGTGRLLPDGQIGRMAVLKDWRRRGVGAAIIEALIEEARRRGYAAVTTSVALQPAQFYRSEGFVAEGKVYREADILQHKMRKALV